MTAPDEEAVKFATCVSQTKQSRLFVEAIRNFRERAFHSAAEPPTTEMMATSTPPAITPYSIAVGTNFMSSSSE
jgi:hypothetical protein